MEVTDIRDATVGPATLNTPTTAIRLDEALGIGEEVSFLGPGRDKLFGCLHRPLGAPRAGILVCSPIDAEMRRHYRKEVLLGRALASRGVAVARFHYRGSGHSDGLASQLTHDSMVEDALAASEWLTERTGSSRIGFVGTRWGAMVAAGAARKFEGAPLALWDPIVDASAYLREVMRLRLMHLLKRGGDRPSTQALIEEIHDRGFIDVIGDAFHRAFYESASDKHLDEDLPAGRHVLLIQISLDRELRGEYVDLADRCRRSGSHVTTRNIVADIPWWFRPVQWEPEERRPSTNELLDATIEWLDGRFPPGEGE